MQVFSEDVFYAWTYARPMSPWVYAGSGLAVVLVLLACFFPLAPYYVKVSCFARWAAASTTLVSLGLSAPGGCLQGC